MKIGILSKLGHMECLGFLLEALKQHEISVIVCNNTDTFKFIDLYKLINKNVNYIIRNNISQKDIQKYDHAFNLTAGDWYQDTNVISILHILCQNNKHQNMISLTPYVKDTNVTYMFPVFSPIMHTTLDKTILCIGYCKNESISKNTIRFFHSMSEYQFIYITWGDRSYSNLENIKNVRRIDRGMSAIDMTTLIAKCSFILSKNPINYDRFCGQLSMAVSYEKPLIIDKKTADSYGLPGIIFHKDYTEVLSSFPMNDNVYKEHVSKIREFKNTHLEQNRQKISYLLSK